MQALVACHSFWLVLITPSVVWMASVLSVRQSRWLACGLIAIGSLTLAGVVIWQMVSWLPQIGPGQPSYLPQRILFTLGTMIELPIMQLLIGGFVLLGWKWLVSGRMLRDA